MKILVIYANAGGGHRSVALALQEGFRQYHPHADIFLLDILSEYTPFPFNRFPDIYPVLTRGRGNMWQWLYKLSDGKRQSDFMAQLWWPMLHRRIDLALAAYPADVVISVYPLLNRLIGRQLHTLPAAPPFVVQITDLGTAHTSWFSEHADFYLMPTRMVYQRALSLGIPEEKMALVGLPVSLAFTERVASKAALQQKLGLATSLPVVLVIGGADGMGQLQEIVAALDRRHPPVQLVVITGRNARLQSKLASKKWSIPVKVLGFVDNMYEWMQAADLLLSKAGPSTISEALAASLPIILTGYLPGQEEANVEFVLRAGAGAYESVPSKIAALVEGWTAPGNPVLAKMQTRIQRRQAQNATKNSVDMLVTMGTSFQHLRPGVFSSPRP